MILLADGGSTKIDWRLVDNGKQVKQVSTRGANPFFRSREDISAELEVALLPEIKDYPVNTVFFYGAGCTFPDKNEIVRSAIADHIPKATIEVTSDLLAAARGLCGTEKGIACILGTGSNSCYYDGSRIVHNVSPLGYVIGDEGSGAVLGKLFVGACLKNQLGEDIKERFLKYFDLTPADILDRVYKQPLANRFLAGFAPFIIQNIDDPMVESLVRNAFKDFFVKNVMQYNYQDNVVHLTGSIAHYYQDIICATATDLGLTIGTINQSPMEGLINYHSKI